MSAFLASSRIRPFASNQSDDRQRAARKTAKYPHTSLSSEVKWCCNVSPDECASVSVMDATTLPFWSSKKRKGYKESGFETNYQKIHFFIPYRFLFRFQIIVHTHIFLCKIITKETFIRSNDLWQSVNKLSIKLIKFQEEISIGKNFSSS